MNQTASKKTLKALLPYGMLATKRWLLEQGLGVHTLDNAVKSKTLLPLASGVYTQYSPNIRWEGVVASLQRMHRLPNSKTPAIQVGGLSALELSGLSQYLSLSAKRVVHLYAQNKLPSWLGRLSLSTKFKSHGTKGLWLEALIPNSKFVKTHQWEEGLSPVTFSCPEKAIMEVLVGVPESVSYEHAEQLMQGLINLSPNKLDILLMACRSIKVKRLFFWLAQRQNYPWFKRLDRSKYDLGSGKRVIAKEGKLDTEYLITVPKDMYR